MVTVMEYVTRGSVIDVTCQLLLTANRLPQASCLPSNKNQPKIFTPVSTSVWMITTMELHFLWIPTVPPGRCCHPLSSSNSRSCSRFQGPASLKMLRRSPQSQVRWTAGRSSTRARGCTLCTSRAGSASTACASTGTPPPPAHLHGRSRESPNSLSPPCTSSLRRVYVVNKEVCVRTVCAHEELLRADLCRDQFPRCGVAALTGQCGALGSSCGKSCGGC
uniref:Microfibril associated protein 2 n=1 Tax=Paramormyrops kingsleyae TaxID=1676925 RepID=A0A3B3RBA7_9TELE